MRLAAEEPHIKIYRCGACTHRFSIISQEQQETYEEKYFREGHKNWFAHPWLKLFRLIHWELQKFKHERGMKTLRMIDVGSGNGDLLKFLKKEDPSYELTGIDLYQSDAVPGIHFIKGDFYKERLNETFDTACCLGTIEHVPDPHRLLQIIAELLRPRGILIMMTVNSDSLIHRIARTVRKLGLRGPHQQLYSHHHLQHYTNRSLKELLLQEGFEILSQKNANNPLRGVDVRKDGVLLEMLYCLGVAIIFPLSAMLGNGIYQIAVARKTV